MITKQYKQEIEDIDLYCEIRKEMLKRMIKENVGLLVSESTINKRDEIILQEYKKRLAEKKGI